MKRRTLAVTAFAASLIAGCGAPANDVPTDLAVPLDLAVGTRGPTDHPPLPRLRNAGGAVLPAAEIWTVVWKGDEPLGDQVNRFHDWLLTSDYWIRSLGQYAIGAGRARGLIVMDKPVPASVDDVAFQVLTGELVQSAKYAVGPNTVFAYVLPERTTLNAGGSSCVDFGGYHSETDNGVPYIALPRCPGFNGISGFDVLTVVASHEAAEVVTDPKPYTSPGWTDVNYPGSEEIGDLCNTLNARIPSSLVLDDAGVPDGGVQGFLVQRLYSNAARDAGLDPCVPDPPGQPYFGAAVDPFRIESGAAGDVAARVELFAFGEVGAINWKLPNPMGGPIHFDPFQGSGRAGDTIPITVHVARSLGAGTYLYRARATNDVGGRTFWFFEVAGK